MQAPICTIVIPCYNEASRLEAAPFVEFVDRHGQEANLLFVDDGSKDDTERVLGEISALRPSHLFHLRLEKNQGKAEAVRTGMRHALARGATIVGYLDADLATPLSEIRRMLEFMQARTMDVVIASRVALHGFDIQRDAVRHYTGRIFATLASVVLRWRIYDTQCGAKLFRASPTLDAALAEPFISRWGFDIELLGRLIIGAPRVPGVPLNKVSELPLMTWKDVPGSKIHPMAMFTTVRQLARIEMDLRQRRARAARA